MGRSLLVLQLIGQPIEALVESVPVGGAGGLDVPVTLAQGVQTQLVCDLRSVHGVGQILRDGYYMLYVLCYMLYVICSILDIIYYMFRFYCHTHDGYCI